MKAFIEEICEHAGIIRVGPDADCYGKPFEAAVAFKVEFDGDGNRVATIKALMSCTVPLTVAHARAAFEALADRGFKVRWSRFGDKFSDEKERWPNDRSDSFLRRFGTA